MCFTLAIQILDLLNSAFPISGPLEPQAVIVSLAAFTDERDPWVDTESCKTATRLLQDFLEDLKHVKGKFASTIEAILKGTIRPLFAKSKNPAITSQGRKNIRTVHADYNSSVMDPETKPWKYHHIYAVSVFRWVLRNLNVRIFSEFQGLANANVVTCRQRLWRRTGL